MPVYTYCRAFEKWPINTLSYMSAISGLMDDARTNIFPTSAWQKEDVQFIDCGSFITMFIVYGENP